MRPSLAIACRSRTPAAGQWSFVQRRPRSVAPPNAPSTSEIQTYGAIMSVKKEPSGRRSIQVEVEVPGSPEEVWQAIATGPGVSSWFVPTEMEEVDGKPVAVKSNFGPG